MEYIGEFWVEVFRSEEDGIWPYLMDGKVHKVHDNTVFWSDGRRVTEFYARGSKQMMDDLELSYELRALNVSPYE